MVLKRDHKDAEIEHMAQKFRDDWSEGQVIRSWLRQHGEELRNLVRYEDWSWENIGKALSKAGIQFKTDKGWAGENVRRAVDLAMKPKKARMPKSQAPKAPVPAPIAPSAPIMPMPLVPPRAAGEPEFKIIQRGPGSAVKRNPSGAGEGEAREQPSEVNHDGQQDRREKA